MHGRTEVQRTPGLIEAQVANDVWDLVAAIRVAEERVGRDAVLGIQEAAIARSDDEVVGVVQAGGEAFSSEIVPDTPLPNEAV